MGACAQRRIRAAWRKHRADASLALFLYPIGGPLHAGQHRILTELLTTLVDIRA
jgi:hypothetical protein